jgi:hypothetical protein
LLRLGRRRGPKNSQRIPWLPSGEIGRRDVLEAKNFITPQGLAGSSANYFLQDRSLSRGTAPRLARLVFFVSKQRQSDRLRDPPQQVPEYIYYYMLTAKESLVAQAVGSA